MSRDPIDLLIRAEEESNRAAVHALNEAAFGTRTEADLVDSLRAQAHPGVSLVADDAGAVVGLAPMAVAPSYQRRGIGSALGAGAVVVLGHPGSPAASFGIKSEYDVPEEVFMLTELRPGYLHGASGTIQYHAAFKDL